MNNDDFNTNTFKKMSISEICQCMYNDDCRDELRESNKHEIIVKISQVLGDDPHNLSFAEMIFDAIKYDLANFVIQHEYCEQKREVQQNLLLWLDSKTNPNQAQELTSFFCKLFK